jgi:hypothetical protein
MDKPMFDAAADWSFWQSGAKRTRVIPRCKVLREQRTRRAALGRRLAHIKSHEREYDWTRPTVFLPLPVLPADAVDPIAEPKPGLVARVIRRLFGY